MIWRPYVREQSNELRRLANLSPREVLEISEGASLAQIKEAYRKQVKIYHPDVADPFMRHYNEQVIRS